MQRVRFHPVEITASIGEAIETNQARKTTKLSAYEFSKRAYACQVLSPRKQMPRQVIPPERPGSFLLRGVPAASLLHLPLLALADRPRYLRFRQWHLYGEEGLAR
jgi:hypothetical protein